MTQEPIYIPFSIMAVMLVFVLWTCGLSFSPKRGGWIANQFNAEHWIIQDDSLFHVESRFLWHRHGWFYGMDERFTFHSKEEAEAWIVKNFRVHSIHYTSEA